MSTTIEREQFLAFLKRRGHRATGERLAVFDAIYAQHGHIDAERLLGSLQARGAKVSRASVYRHLDLMVECGLVRRSRLGEGRYQYEHLHEGQDHDHLVCTSCGRVVELVNPGIAALHAEICRAHGFVPTRHAVQIHGLCNGCAAEQAQGRE